MIIEFPAPAPLLNLNGRQHWSKKAPIVAEWRRATWAWSLQAAFGDPRPLPPSTVKVTLPVKSLVTRRDPHNFIPTVKPIIDGLVDAKFWPDDTAEWVTVIDPEFWTGGMVLVEINPRSTP